jgi:uncharacterized OB-fold protein
MTRSDNAPQKVLGKPDDLNLEFFQRIAATGRMHLQRCDSCGNYAHPPRMYCPRCFSGEYSYEEISGLGSIYSYTVSHHTAEPAWQAELPYTTVVVELDEGPRIVAAAAIDDPKSIRIGRRVRITAERRTDDFAYFTAQLEGEQADA